jgi:hypothetical protein
VLDRRFLATVAGVPQSTLGERKAEQDIIRRRFPALARLPLDRNSDDPLPLTPSLGYLLGRALRWRIRPRARGGRWAEHLPYYRESDFNGDAWRVVRAEADRCRDAVDGLLDRAALDRLLPPAHVRPEFKDAIIHSSGLKLLVGTILWASEFR